RGGEAALHRRTHRRTRGARDGRVRARETDARAHPGRLRRPARGRVGRRGSAVVTPGRRPFYGPWIIAASFVTFGLASGLPYYNIAFFYDYLRDDHHWTQPMVTLGAPIAILLTIWAGPILTHRFNPRYLIVAGTVLTCVA